MNTTGESRRVVYVPADRILTNQIPPPARLSPQMTPLFSDPELGELGTDRSSSSQKLLNCPTREMSTGNAVPFLDHAERTEQS